MEKERIGRRIKAFRKLKGYTQVNLAKELGISVTTLSCIERGVKEVDEKILQKIADTLAITIDEITLKTTKNE